MKKGYIFLILFSSSFLYPQSDTSLILNEIMFYPTSGDNEFIEFYNLSGTESFDLKYYKIKIHSSNNDVITDAGFGTILAPNSYAVIMEGDYDLASGIYSNIISQEALILKISDNAFGSSGMSNTSDRTVYLINSNNDTIDAHTYQSEGNSPGISDEKISLNRDITNNNWGNSLRINGTPGFKNSITPSDFDLQISTVSIIPAIIFSGEMVNIRITVKNIGRNDADIFEAEVFRDKNWDSSVNEEEKIFSQNYNNLFPEDSLVITVPSNFEQPGYNYIICRITYAPDEDLSNNIFLYQVYVHQQGNNYNDIIINEIMYAPPAGEPEWIEIFNRSDSSINIKNWCVGDNSNLAAASAEVLIQPDSFLILSKDSAIHDYYSVQSPLIVVNLPALNNSGDALILKDSLGIIIDSMEYLPEWGGSSGKSLERIDPFNSSTVSDNWKSSINKYKATPGYINSVAKKDFDLELSEIIFNPPHPVFGDNVSISAKVKNAGKIGMNFNLILSEDTDSDSIPDRLLEQLNSLELIPEDSIELKFNYAVIDIQRSLTFHILINCTPDLDTSNNYLVKNIAPGYPVSSVLINEIMYSPVNGEPEWIEIYNATEDTINLKSWLISDVLTLPSKAEIETDIHLPGKSFLVISKDSTIFNYHRIIPSDLLILNFPNLNNDADGIVLKDDRGLKIDSAVYQSTVDRNGHSLERISLTGASTLYANWNSSNDLEFSTPGRINTATPKLNDLSISEIFFNPRFPVEGEDVLLQAEIKNNGSLNASNFLIKFLIDNDLNGVPQHEIGTTPVPLLTSGDSLVVASQTPIKGINKKISAAVKIIFIPDEDTLNNYAEKSVEPGFSKNSVLINEIMFDPEDNEPEWIEIINASDDSVDLINWSVSDLQSTPVKDFIANENLFISPGELMILAKDTTFYSAHPETQCKIKFVNFGVLGKSTDGVLIYDFRNAVIDSLYYKPSWGSLKGFSLERISLYSPAYDSSNWAVSLSEKKSTPGFPNSITGVPEYKRNSVVINEIMFDPDIDNCEFLEFYNQSNEEVNIGGWKIEDEKGNLIKLSEANFKIPPDSYFAVFSDSLGMKKYNLYENPYIRILSNGDLGLTNASELILLKDLKGKMIDSVWYSEKWHNSNFVVTKNRSLERINPQINGNDKFNWSSSADLSGATPGRRNSIFTNRLQNIQAEISVSPNPFSPDDDGFEDFTIINCRLSKATSQIRIKIFDSRGRLVRTLLNNQAAGHEQSFVFNGLEDNGSKMRIGIYIVFLEALDENSGVVETLKTTIVIARRLN